MKVLINLSNIRKGGAMQVALSFLNTLSTQDKVSGLIVINPSLYDELLVDFKNKNFGLSKYLNTPTIVKALTNKNEILDKFVEKYDIDIVFTLFGPSYWKPKVKHVSGYAIPHHIYPESPFFNTLSYIEKIKYFFLKNLQRRSLKSSNSIFWVETTDVKNRLSEFLNINLSSIHVVENGVNPLFVNQKNNQKREREREYTILLVGSYYNHKNFEIINLILKKIKKPLKIVITLDSNYKNHFLDDDRLHLIGKVKMCDLPNLYHNCDLVLMPTLLECFSAVGLEAMYSKKPILASHFGFNTSTLNDNAIYFDPLEKEDFINKVNNFVRGEYDDYFNSIYKEKKKGSFLNTGEKRDLKLLKIIKEYYEEI